MQIILSVLGILVYNYDNFKSRCIAALNFLSIKIQVFLNNI